MYERRRGDLPNLLELLSRESLSNRADRARKSGRVMRLYVNP